MRMLVLLCAGSSWYNICPATSVYLDSSRIAAAATGSGLGQERRAAERLPDCVRGVHWIFHRAD
jgi:hypothetical protein